MKNNKLNYILIPLALAVWVIIVYKVFGALKSSSNKATLSILEESKETNPSDETFQLMANYRDPFDGKAARSKNSSLPSNSETRKIVKPVSQEKPEIRWSDIKYRGTIKRQKDDVLLAIMRVSGKTYTLNKGEEAEGLKVLRIMKDSVLVKYQGQKKMIIK